MNIIVDSHAICHQVKHTISLDYDGMETGILFGVFLKIYKIAKQFNTNRFLFTWDSPSNHRKQYFPEYKLGRLEKKTEDEIEFNNACYRQFNILKKDFLPRLGFTCIEQEGYEADDLIASVVKNNPDLKFTIISGDNDLYQLLSNNVSMFSKVVFTQEDFMKEYGVNPTDWNQIKAMAGCTSDQIPGIPKVGTLTACRYLRNELKVTSSAYQTIRRHKKIIDFNLPLVTLPYKGTLPYQFPNEFDLSFDEFLNICTTYGFRSFLEEEQLKKWVTVLQLH